LNFKLGALLYKNEKVAFGDISLLKMLDGKKIYEIREYLSHIVQQKLSGKNPNNSLNQSSSEDYSDVQTNII
jgi:hypothetical protein